MRDKEEEEENLSNFLAVLRKKNRAPSQRGKYKTKTNGEVLTDP